MLNNDIDSLNEIIKSTAMDVLSLSEEVASNFANIVTAKVTGFF